jgi:RNA polymerase sigma-70 factor (ECF subfamily)
MDHSSSPLEKFASTRWSLIASANEKSPRRLEALSSLCEIYWLPVYAFIRRRGYQPEDAQDLTQELFANILRRDGFASADPSKGRFRSYLLGAVKNLLAEQERNRRTQKRGGQVKIWSFDWGSAEQCLQWEPTDTRTPEQIFEYRWASSIVADTLASLDELNSDPARQSYYQRLRAYLGTDQESLPYAAIASELGVSESALRVQVHRLRKKFRELLRLRIADTLANPSELEEELAYLMNCLRIG